MNKVFILILVLAMLPIVALADLPDISNLSFDELVALKDQINLAMWESEEWQEVTVPEGTYEIGKDIPAGHWTFRVAGHGYFYIYYFDKLDEFGKKFAIGSKHIMQDIASEDFKAFDQEYLTEYDLELKEGWYVWLGGKTIFTPYTGKPSLGFK